jgi:imidazolonepropionase-like amidohydrolase
MSRVTRSSCWIGTFRFLGLSHFAGCLWAVAVSLVVGAGCTPGPLAKADSAGGLSAAVRTPAPMAPAGVTAFVNVNVIPMDAERVLADQTVLVQGGWITALGPSDQMKVPAGAVRIDGRGKYLMPGLADMHAHLFSANTADSMRAARDLFRYVAYGVTTIRNMDHNTGFQPVHPQGGTRDPVLRLRARAATGALVSPRIYTAGQWGPSNYTNQSATMGNFAGLTTAVKHASAVRLDSIAAYVAAYQAAGYDFIKPYHEADLVFDSLLVVARRLGIPLAGHIPHTDTSITIERVLASGAYASIEHGMRYPLITTNGWALDEGRLAALAGATRRAGVWNTPTLAIHGQPGSNEQALSVFRRVVKVLHDSGAGLLLGADANSNPLFGSLPKPGSGVHQELEALVGAGLTPYQALATGTKNVAQYFGTLDSTGTVAVGKRADLVLLRGNPLEDIRNMAQPAGVMLGGRWLPREELDRSLSDPAVGALPAPANRP